MSTENEGRLIETTADALPGLLGTYRLKQCPNCDYSLYGLPKDGLCPECGCAFEKDAVCFPVRVSAGHAIYGLLLVSLILVFLAKGFYWVWSNFAVKLLVIVVAADLLRQMWMFRQYYYRRQYLLVSRTGLEWLQNGMPRMLIKWTDIRRIDQTSHRTRVFLETEKVGRIEIPGVFLPRDVAAAEFASFLEHRWTDSREFMAGDNSVEGVNHQLVLRRKTRKGHST